MSAMVWAADRQFIAQLRDMQDHNSDTGEEAGFTVLTDENHTADLSDYLKHVVYIEDTHSTAFDLQIQSAAADDEDYSGAVDEQTVSFTTSDDAERITFPDGVGRLRFRFLGNTAGTAPAEGATTITVQSVGKQR